MPEPLTLAELDALTPAQLRIVALDAAGHVAPLLPKVYQDFIRAAWLILHEDMYRTLQYAVLDLPRPLPGDHAINFARAAVLWALQPEGSRLDVIEACRAAGDVAHFQGRTKPDQVARQAAEWARQHAVVAALSTPVVERRAA